MLSLYALASSPAPVSRVVAAPRRFSVARWLGALTLLLASFLPIDLVAQGVDVIRGRIVGPDSLPIAGARVAAMSLSGNVTRTAKSGTDGRFTITFPGGEGDYLVTVTSIGFAPKRFEVKRTADQEILVADAKLTKMAAELDEVRVVGERARTNRDDRSPDISGSERSVSNANVAANSAGDLASMAASLPGVQLVPGANGDPSGFSVLGLTPDQNNTTLNGQSFGSSNLPRDAGVSTSLVTSAYDVSRGGFSGGQFVIRTQPGSNFQRRTGSVYTDAPALQFTDAAGRALGQTYTNVSASGLLSGPIVTDKAFYNFSWQAGRRASDLRTIGNTSALGLTTSGVSPDSAARLVGILSRLGIPISPLSNPSYRFNDQASTLAAIDFAPPGSRVGAAYNLTANGSWNRSDPAGGSVTELPSHSGTRTSYSGGLQGRHSAYFDNGVLTETSLSASINKNAGSAYFGAPSGTVQIASQLDSTASVKSISFGGSPFIGTNRTTRQIGAQNTLSWFSTDNKHRLKLTSELRREDYSQDQTFNANGSYLYNSLADLEAGTPVSFTRSLSPRVRSGAQTIGAVSLGDSYRRSNDLQVQYGVRVDGNWYDGTPQANADLQQKFGVRNDLVPNRVYVSPRVGFSWQYGTAPQIAGFDGAVRGPRAVVRGGIGVFQNTPSTTLPGTAFDNTGLPSAVQQLGCVGAAVPAAQWGTWFTNPASIPTTCANGLGSVGFGNTSPNVTLFANNFAASRSVRGNLQWNGPVLANRFTASVDVTASNNLNQQSTRDLNFDPTVRFTLPDEGGRPVYAPVTAISPISGASAPGASRVSSAYNQVNSLESDLRSTSRQVTVRLSPSTFSTALTWSLSYVYATVREQTRGFQSTAGDPRAIDWSRSSFDSRHQIQATVGYNFFDAVRVSWFSSLRSGSPFTPVIGGDVNGDGLSNDRAFIFNPATTADPALAASMRSLLASATGDTKRCLDAQLGQLATRNSCQGPWTQQSILSVSLNPVKFWLPQRATLSFQVSNPLGAADLLLHGENGLRGWGQPNIPDATLLYPRGFNAATQRYTYAVNQRFGGSQPAVTALRNPVAITAMLRIDLGPPREKQLLIQQLDRGRSTEGQKATEPLLNALYGAGGVVINPMAQILRQGDSLALTAPQGDSLATMNRQYLIKLNQLWAPVVKELAALPDAYDRKIAYEKYRTTREKTVDLLRTFAPRVKAVLTADQLRQLPQLVSSHLDDRYLLSIRTATVGDGGANMFFPGGLGGAPGGGGGTVIIRQ